MVLCHSIYGIKIGFLGKGGMWHFNNKGSQLAGKLKFWMELPEKQLTGEELNSK